MTVSVEQQVFGFEISIYYALRMEIIQRKSDLSGIEFGHGIGKTLQNGKNISKEGVAPGYSTSPIRKTDLRFAQKAK